MKYETMTVGGLRGSSFEAPDDETAEAEAERAGYTVVDIIYGFSEDRNVNTLVVTD
jgi:hypothetical protein